MEIRKAVRESDVVVVCLSKQFNQAGFRQKEVRLALDTAMEKPEGEIFIIPARLEECDNLESLRKWHWVNLFEENGYEMLISALQVRADKIGVGIKSEDVIKRETPSPSSKPSTVIDGLNWATVRQSTIFYARLCDAFPGLRGTEKISGEETINRLNILLRSPLSVDLGVSPLDGQINPLWWTRGRVDMHVHDYESLSKDRILINNLELHVDHIVAVRAFGVEERDFVYVQALPEEATGLYHYEDNWLHDYLQDRLKNFHGYYSFEEYGLWNDRMVTRHEYDDGAAVIDGKPTRITGAKLRLRYITPYNFVICGGDHVLFGIKRDATLELTKLFDEILLETKTVADLVNFVKDLPIAPKYT